MKLVSVIIPCYKDSKTLCRAINSVIAQSYKPIEIIVINDCSPETKIIEKHLKKYPRIKYFCNKENLGLAASRNKGIQIAKGEIVAFLDADDEYHPDKIKIQLEYLKENTAVTCEVLNILPSGKSYSKLGPDRSIIKPREIMFSNKLNGAGLLCKKKMILGIGGFNPNLKSCEDYDLWLRLLSSGANVNVVSKPLYLYYFNSEGLSKNIIDISKWELRVVQQHASSMDLKWQNNFDYILAIFIWLIRHLFRSEEAGNLELRNETLKNGILLSTFPILKSLFYIIGYLRICFFFAMFKKYVLSNLPFKKLYET
jgi:glycosyltransferase involved in cell wall biosynthesis